MDEFYYDPNAINTKVIHSRDDVISINEIDYNNYFTAERFVINEYGPSEVSYNSLSSWRSAEGYDLNGSAVDPQFVDMAMHNYRLSTNSPLNGAGKNNANVGAYLSANDVIGTYFNQPSPPSNLTVQ